MTQEQNPRVSSTNKRSSRQGRNRPVLVTSSSVESESTVQEQVATPVVEETPVVTKPAPRTRRLPGFFSTVGKSEQSEAESKKEITDARLARAMRSKGVTTESKTATPQKKNAKSETKPAPKAASTSSRPGSGFKTRYLFGMLLYLLGANFIGIYEQSFVVSQGWERLLFSIGPLQVRTSTLLFLATLVLLLVILARLDLIPRSLGAMTGSPAPQKKPGQSGTGKGESDDSSRSQQPTMRQGVRGADDDLYQEYRANQRREKKK